MVINGAAIFSYRKNSNFTTCIIKCSISDYLNNFDSILNHGLEDHYKKLLKQNRVLKISEFDIIDISTNFVYEKDIAFISVHMAILPLMES